jgi:hypothetical protein
MTSKSAFLSIFFFATLSFSFAQERITTDDFIIDIPDGWNALSNEYLESLQAKTDSGFYQKGFEPPRGYVIGYCDNENLVQEPPFLLGIFTALEDYNSVTFDTIVVSSSRSWTRYDVKPEPIKDVENNRFYLEFQFGGMYLFVGYIPGGTGLLQLSFYSELNRVNERRSQFLSIYESVVHKTPYVYYDPIAEADKEVKRSGKFLGIATAMFIVVAVGRYFVKKAKKDA